MCQIDALQFFCVPAPSPHSPVCWSMLPGKIHTTGATGAGLRPGGGPGFVENNASGEAAWLAGCPGPHPHQLCQGHGSEWNACGNADHVTECWSPGLVFVCREYVDLKLCKIKCV